MDDSIATRISERDVHRPVCSGFAVAPAELGQNMIGIDAPTLCTRRDGAVLSEVNGLGYVGRMPVSINTRVE